MKPGIPWNVKGIEQEAREIAKAAARKSGMTLGEWLNSAIISQGNPSAIGAISESNSRPKSNGQHRRPSKRRRSNPSYDSNDNYYYDGLDNNNQEIDSIVALGNNLSENYSDAAMREQILKLSKQINKFNKSSNGYNSDLEEEYSDYPDLDEDNEEVHILNERIERNEEKTAEIFDKFNNRLDEIQEQIKTVNEESDNQRAYQAFESALKNVVDHIEVTDKKNRETLTELQGRIEELSATATANTNEKDNVNNDIIEALANNIDNLVDKVKQIENTAVKNDGAQQAQELKKQIEFLQNKISSIEEDTSSVAKKAATSDSLKIELNKLNARLNEVAEDTNLVAERAVDRDGLEKKINEINNRLASVEGDTGLAVSQTRDMVLTAQQEMLDVESRINEATEHELKELQEKMEQILSRIVEANEIEEKTNIAINQLHDEISDISQHINEIRESAAWEQDLENLQESVSTLSSKMEDTNSSSMAAMEERLAEITKKLDNTESKMQNSTVAHIEHVMSNMQNLEEKLQEIQSAPRSEELLKGLEGHIHRISERLNNAEQRFSSFQKIEGRIDRLFSTIQESQQNAEQIAKREIERMSGKVSADQARKSSKKFDEISETIKKIERVNSENNINNKKAFTNVNGTLEKISSRLNNLEGKYSDIVNEVAKNNKKFDLAELRLPPVSDSDLLSFTPGDEKIPPTVSNKTSEDINKENSGENSSPKNVVQNTPLAKDNSPKDQPTNKNAKDWRKTAAAKSAEFMAELYQKGSEQKKATNKTTESTSTKVSEDSRPKANPGTIINIPDIDITAQQKDTKNRNMVPQKPQSVSSETGGNKINTPIKNNNTASLINNTASYTQSTPVYKEDFIAAARRAAQASAKQAYPSNIPPNSGNQEYRHNENITSIDKLREISRAKKQSKSWSYEAKAVSSAMVLLLFVGVATYSYKSMFGDKSSYTENIIASNIADNNIIDGNSQSGAENDLENWTPTIVDPNATAGLGDMTTNSLSPNTQVLESNSSRKGSMTPSTKTEARITEESANSNLPKEIAPVGLRNAASSGDPLAQFVVATKYATGEVVKRDYAAAARWYNKSASRGLAQSQYNLALLYEKGLGVPRDINSARIWYERAAEKGNVKAMHNLAAIYADETKQGHDYSKAARWFRQAAIHGVKDSQYNLGYINQHGLGTKKNLLEAYKWYALAAKQGDQAAKQDMERIEVNIDPVEVANITAMAENWTKSPAKASTNNEIISEARWDGSSTASSGANRDIITAEAQNLLNKLGYNVGTADGIMGPKTTSAIKEFQSKVGLSPTGSINSELINALRIHAQ